MQTVLVLALCLGGLVVRGQAPVVGPERGSLVVIGGGGKHFRPIFGHFLELGGGTNAHLVVVPTASSSDLKKDYSKDFVAEHARRIGVRRVTVLHTHDRSEADTEAFAAPLKTATALWFGGGRQWRFVKAYGGTRCEAAFRSVLERGGVIGGSSAGASIQGSFLARGDTRTNTLMIGDVQRGFGYLKNSAIDQHLIARKRERDLIRLLEDPEGRMDRAFARADLLGIGIDEDSAIVVKGDTCEVIGKPDAAVLMYNPKQWRPGMPDPEKWLRLECGDRYHLGRRCALRLSL